MENLFAIKMEKAKVDAITNLGLAHIGDGAYELLVRSYLCSRGGLTVKRLRRVQEHTLALGDLAPGAWRHLTEEEVAALKQA